MAGPEPITSEELISLKRSDGQPLKEWYGHRRAILGPCDIPVHPSVSAAAQLYSATFVESVMAAVPAALGPDIETIERVLGTDIGVRVEGGGIGDTRGSPVVALGGDGGGDGEASVTASVTEGERVEVACGGASIALDRDDPAIAQYMLWSGMEHVMSLERLREYGAEGGSQLRVPVWHEQDVLSHGEPLYHYFRVFALLFNNMGLEELARAAA